MIQLISSQNPTIKYKIHKFSYQGTFLGESYISATIETSQPIVFAIGDYVEYRGERFVLNYIPAKQKQARSGTHGSAFVYENIKFNSIADELTRVEFLDVVLADNKIHYSSLSDFSFYAISVKDLASRIQANLDRVYLGDDKWTVNVSPDCVTSDMNIDVTKQNCWAALTLAHSEFGVNFIIRNRTITIGTAGLAVGKLFGYGKGKGLYDIQQTTNADALVITRLRAFGSSRNLPHRYYNKLKKANNTSFINESVYIPNLMLPAFPYQNADPSQIYIDSDSKSNYGLREGSVYFDGSDSTNEIYPSLEGMTKKLLNDAGITVSLKSGDNGNIDECLNVVNPTDNGEIPADGKIPAEFTIYLKDLGFDLSAKDIDEQYVYSATDTMQISMKSGMCVGRTYDVVDKGITKVTDGGYTRYKIECKRFTDDSIAGGTAFPNRNYYISAGDKFVILGIDMPDVYVKTASQRLLMAAKDYLLQHNETKYTYLPKIDEIFMANNPEVGEKLKEGDILNFTDTDLEIDASVIIQTLKISVGDKLIPTYEVTLSNEIVAGTLDKMQSAINQLASSNTGITLEQVKSIIQTYGTRFFLSRLTDDSAEGNIDFVQNVSIGKDLTVHDSLTAKKEVVSNLFGNDNYNTGRFGSGFRMWQNAINGQSYAEFDNLLVRRNMDVSKLTINEIKSVGGQILVSLGHMVCSRVEHVFNGYKCFFDTDNGNITNPFAPNDQLICQRFDTDRIIYYWRRVMQLGTDYVVLSNKDKDGDGIPSAGDEMIQFGNRTLTERQSAILISAYGSDAPSIKQYANVDTYNLTGKEITVISPNGNKFSGTFEVSTGGQKFRVPADRGIWDANTVYGYYDRVTHNGTLWLCVIQEGQTTIHEPNDNLSHWLKQVSEGKKGEQGLQGVAGVKGEDGKTTYTWIRYADTITGGGISNLPTNKLYIGLAYNKTTATESNLPTDYKWSLIKGDKGDTGVEGTKGKDGATTYTWIKYADVADGTGLYDLPKATTKYIGIAVNKTVAAESTNKADYTWSLFKGADGADGTNGTNGKDGRDGVNGSQGIAGTSSYFHVRYSANANGNPMTTTPAKYIGTAAPTGYTSYSWYEWKGAQGTDGKQGIAGTSGANGQTSYLHIKYSNDGGKTLTGNAGEDVGDWIGQYVDFTAADSNDVKKYLWSKIKGQAGDLIYVKGTNWNKNTLARVEVNGVTVSSPTTRGLTLTVLKRTDLSLVFKQSYDIYGTDANIATTLADKIKSYDSNHFIILNSYDAIKFNTNLINAMVSVGATGQFLNGRYSYALIGYKGLAKGAALEVTVFDTNEPYYAEIATNVINGQFVGTGTNVETIQSVVNASFQILDDKIASKVSQTDFSSLSGRVSTAESKIVQQAGQITSTVQKVEGKNAVYKSYTAAVTDRPPVPYAKNDIWITYEGVMKQSKVNRITGVFVEADWADTTKYTDDTAVNNLQIGGRNNVLKTSNVWSANAVLNNTNNQNIFQHRVKVDGWKEGETICISFDYKYDKIVKHGTINAITFQGSGNVTAWVNGFSGHNFLNKVNFTSGSGIVTVTYTFKLTAAQVTNAHFDINIRHDYLTGNVSIRNLKVEKGTKPTDWVAAPEDIQDTITAAQTAANNAQNTACKKVRYIRDWLNGSTANTGNHWVQVAAYNTAGTNIALNKTVIGAGDNRVTNGNTDTNPYTGFPEGIKSLTVDLGAVYDINKVKVWHYYADSRTYNATKTECSVDNVNWFTVFDSAVGGKYKETSVGNVCLVGDYANNAENQNRNRTYYSDTTPVVPEGGHKTGDLWYKISLSAGCYTTYRWNGTAWVVINEYVSKAQQIITDNSITNLVTRTGIGSLGTGETLMSKINQTANNITLEVGKIQIGGTNLFLNSSFTNGFASWSQNGGSRVIDTDLVHGKVVKFVATAVNQGMYQNPSSRRTSGKTYVISGYMKSAVNNTKVRIAHEGGAGTKDVTLTTAWQRFETVGVWTSGGSVCFYSTAASTFYLAKLQYEEGNKSSAWSPAPEDVPFMVGSTLSLDNNKITLASNVIELNGLTITKTLEASTATIGGFKVENGKFESVSQTSGKPNLFLDGKNGTAYLRGGLITPFQGGYYRLGSGGGVEMSTYGLQDNNNVVITGYGGGWKTAFTVPFTSQYNGFRATILNDNFEGKTSLGTIDTSAPAGKYFFERGERKSYLTVRRNEGVEMIGYGEGSVFHGWIILNRFDTNIHNQNGAAVTVHNMGMVKSNRIYKQTRHDPISSMTRLSEGKYRLYFKEPYSNPNNYMVMLTCETTGGGVGRYASVITKTNT